MEPLSGNMEEMASKILSEGNFLVLSLLVRPGDDTHAFHQSTKLTLYRPSVKKQQSVAASLLVAAQLNNNISS